MKSPSPIVEELETRKAFARNSSALLASQFRAEREGTQPPLMANQVGVLQIERYENEQRISDLEAQQRLKLRGSGPRIYGIDMREHAKTSEQITA